VESNKNDRGYNLSDMKYFITGGAGFIGSHLAEKLLDSGAVTVYDNLSSGKDSFIKHLAGQKGFNFIKADLLDLDMLKKSMRGHDVLFHLAANPDVREAIRKTDTDLEQGTIVTYNVLESMRENGIDKVVFASSSTVYGETPVKPLAEDYGPLLPISLYGASKLACEGLISSFCHIFKMKAWIFRFANIVGPRATHGVIFDFINKLKENSDELEILGDGTQQKPYLYVNDCADGMLYGLKNADEQVNVYNLGANSSTRVSDIAKMLIEQMGLPNVKFNYTGGNRGWPGDVPQVRFDTSKMEKLGWKPGFTSDEAVSKAITEIIKEI
jgi:UDP-glucose 4-epimerase